MLLSSLKFLFTLFGILPMTPRAHLDMRGIDVARVVLLVWYKLNPILFVWNNVTETVALSVFGQSCCSENTVCPLLGHLFILSEDPLLFQLQLQSLTLKRQRERRREEGVLVIHMIQRFLIQSPRGFYLFTFHQTQETIQTRRIQKSHYNIRLHFETLIS